MRNWFFLLVFLSAFKVGAYCDSPSIHVFFANGMFNSRKAALSSYRAFKNRFQDQEHKGLTLKFDEVFIAYNTDENLLNQLFEVSRQKSADTDVSFGKYLSKFDEAPDWFKSIAAEIQKAIIFEELLKNKDLQIQVENYRKILENPKNHILAVAHSQGNLFTNFAFTAIAVSDEFSKRLNMISVAITA